MNRSQPFVLLVLLMAVTLACKSSSKSEPKPEGSSSDGKNDQDGQQAEIKKKKEGYAAALTTELRDNVGDCTASPKFREGQPVQPSRGTLQITCKWPADLSKGREWLDGVKKLVGKKCPDNLKEAGFTLIDVEGPDDAKWEAVTYSGQSPACAFVMR